MLIQIRCIDGQQRSREEMEYIMANLMGPFKFYLKGEIIEDDAETGVTE